MCQWFSAVIFFLSFNMTCLLDCLWSLLCFFKLWRVGRCLFDLWLTFFPCYLGKGSSLSTRTQRSYPVGTQPRGENGSGIKRCQSSVATHLNRENMQLEVLCSGCFLSWALGSRALGLGCGRWGWWSTSSERGRPKREDAGVWIKVE